MKEFKVLLYGFEPEEISVLRKTLIAQKYTVLPVPATVDDAWDVLEEEGGCHCVCLGQDVDIGTRMGMAALGHECGISVLDSYKVGTLVYDIQDSARQMGFQPGEIPDDGECPFKAAMGGDGGASAAEETGTTTSRYPAACPMSQSSAPTPATAKDGSGSPRISDNEDTTVCDKRVTGSCPVDVIYTAPVLGGIAAGISITTMLRRLYPSLRAWTPDPVNIVIGIAGAYAAVGGMFAMHDIREASKADSRADPQSSATPIQTDEPGASQDLPAGHPSVASGGDISQCPFASGAKVGKDGTAQQMSFAQLQEALSGTDGDGTCPIEFVEDCWAIKDGELVFTGDLSRPPRL